MKAKTKIDLFISIILWALVVFLIIFMIIAPPHHRAVGYPISIIAVIFLVWVYFGTNYELREDYLYCKCGPLRQKISYDSIKSLRFTINIFSSMALSLNRIEIKQSGKGFIAGTTFISPKELEAFYHELKKRCNNLEE